LESARKILADVGKALPRARHSASIIIWQETVQNLLVIRFANSIFEPLWTRITRPCPNHVAEEEGLTLRDPKTHEITGSRIAITRASRLADMVQNHILQSLMPDSDGATLVVSAGRGSRR